MVIFQYNLFILGFIFEPCYIQNGVIMNRVIKRLQCIEGQRKPLSDCAYAWYDIALDKALFFQLNIINSSLISQSKHMLLWVPLQQCSGWEISTKKHAYSNILKILQPKNGLFSDKKILIFFIFLLKDLDCGYSLELPHRGSSNEYSQSMFLWVPTIYVFEQK